MVGGMAGRIEDIERNVPDANVFAAVERDQILPWDRKAFAVEPDQIAAIEAAGAGEEARRIGHMRGAEFVDVHLEARIFTNQRTGSASMVEVDVSQQQEVKRLEVQSASAQARAVRFNR